MFSSSSTSVCHPQCVLKNGEVLDVILPGNNFNASFNKVDPLSSSSSLVDPLPPAVTVVILTYGRPEIYEALESVSHQDFSGRIDVLVLGDNYVGMDTDSLQLSCSSSASSPAEKKGCRKEVQLTVLNYSNKERNTYHRVARLRNIAVELATTSFIAFLDDDNMWEPNHLSSLVEAIQQKEAEEMKRISIVHSWRRLVFADNTPFVPQRYPWLPAGEESERLFELYLQGGIMSAGDSVLRDRAYCTVSGAEYGMVDMGEWMFRKEFFEEIRFDDHSPAGNDVLHSGEDDKLLRHIRERSIPMACSCQPSLRYRLGGFSNSHTTTTTQLVNCCLGAANNNDNSQDSDHHPLLGGSSRSTSSTDNTTIGCSIASCSSSLISPTKLPPSAGAASNSSIGASMTAQPLTI